jgi:Arc/MetJ-type ribon-helix-helix transcriptional regulator
MRITIRINDRLFQEMKDLADQRGQSVSDFIEGALRQYLSRHAKNENREPVSLPTSTGRGLLPGVDLDNSVALQGKMDDFDGSHSASP